jgi:hypothetical protein
MAESSTVIAIAGGAGAFAGALVGHTAVVPRDPDDDMDRATGTEHDL